MDHRIFISYSSDDLTQSESVARALESAGLPCWYAARDIQSGDRWGKAIVDAIQASELFVVLFSAGANASRHVVREVERAIHHDVPILPVRLEDVMPTDDLELFLSTAHWFDGFTPTFKARLPELVAQAQRMLNAGKATLPRPPAARPPAAMAARPPAAMAAPAARKWPLVVGALLALAGIGAFMMASAQRGRQVDPRGPRSSDGRDGTTAGPKVADGPTAPIQVVGSTPASDAVLDTRRFALTLRFAPGTQTSDLRLRVATTPPGSATHTGAANAPINVQVDRDGPVSVKVKVLRDEVVVGNTDWHGVIAQDAPTVAINKAESPWRVVDTKALVVTGHMSCAAPCSVLVNGVETLIDGSVWTGTVSLEEGATTTINVVARDALDREATASTQVVYRPAWRDAYEQAVVAASDEAWIAARRAITQAQALGMPEDAWSQGLRARAAKWMTENRIDVVQLDAPKANTSVAFLSSMAEALALAKKTKKFLLVAHSSYEPP